MTITVTLANCLAGFAAWCAFGFVVVYLLAIRDQKTFPRDWVDVLLGMCVAPAWPVYALIRLLRHIERNR